MKQPPDDANRAGRSTREMADKRRKRRVAYLWIAFGILIVLILMLAFSPNILGFGAFGFLAGLIVLTRIVSDLVADRTERMRKEERRAVRGAQAEERIGDLLGGLSADYLVVHDIRSPYGNIDHIVIGKQGGVFLIETKAHGGKVSASSGQLLVNGDQPEKDFVAQALQNSYWLREQIRQAIQAEVWITPLVVFVNAFVERIEPIRGVQVINKKYLLNALQRPDTRPRNQPIWAQRGKILSALNLPPQSSRRPEPPARDAKSI